MPTSKQSFRFIALNPILNKLPLNLYTKPRSASTLNSKEICNIKEPGWTSNTRTDYSADVCISPQWPIVSKYNIIVGNYYTISVVFCTLTEETKLNSLFKYGRKYFGLCKQNLYDCRRSNKSKTKLSLLFTVFGLS